MEAYKPVYEDINITAHLDFYHFYKPNFSELFFLVEKHLLELDLTQTNWGKVYNELSLPKNLSYLITNTLWFWQVGTGKTKTIIHKIKHLIENNHVPSKIAVLTFTRKAANEILYRLSAYLGGQSAAVFAGTFHNFCLLNIRKYDSFFGLHEYRIIDAEDQKQLIK